MIKIDDEGFLNNWLDWETSSAQKLAKSNQIKLTAEHWEIIELVRDYYKDYGLFPANRVLVKLIGKKYGAEKGNSIHIMKLFSGKPAKIIAKVAGLPKPPNCD